MKCFVRGDWITVIMIAMATLTVVVVTQASAAATYLIAFGFLAIAIFWRRLHEPPEDAEGDARRD